ncbi:CHASE2 domain-containing protein [Thalassospira tepidiphila]|uniref:CHASE2 domain-containing protein n=1 Tax=Thalassospira tepidiphila TaxID=393657 RepID=UPI003AA85219
MADATDAVRLSKSFKVGRIKPFWWVIINVVFAALVLWAEPDFIADAVDEYSYSVFNRTVGGPLYPGKHVDDIGIIVLDDESLAGLNSSWPAVYGLHAKILYKLLTAQPKAVFIDFTFRDRRGPLLEGVVSEERVPELYVRDDSLTMLRDILKLYQAENIPVYLQAGAVNIFQHHAVLSELAPYVTLVAGWGDARRQADIRALTYDFAPEMPSKEYLYEGQKAENLPLCDDAIIRSGTGNVRGCDISGITAAAITIYRDFCSGEKRSASIKHGWKCDASLIMPSHAEKPGWLAWRDQLQDRPMWLSWPDMQADYSTWPDGYDADGQAFKPYGCGTPDIDADVSQRVWTNLMVLFGFGERTKIVCPPFHIISAAQVHEDTPSAGRWVGNFKDRIVMYGQNLQGFQDVIRPPTMDIDIPGVFIHAMALENLLSNGSRYLSDKSTYSSLLAVDLIEICTLLLILCLRFGLASIARHIFPPLPKSSSVSYRDYNPAVYFVLTGWNKILVFLSMIRVVPRMPYVIGVWFRNWVSGSRWSASLDLETRELARNWFMCLICLLDLLVSVAIVTFGAIILELTVLSIAPVNWLAVVGLGLLSYIPFVRSLFASEDDEIQGIPSNDQSSKGAAGENSASA